MATSWDDYLADQSYRATQSYQPAYQPAYDAGYSYDPGYAYDPYHGYEAAPAYDAGYDYSGYDTAPAYSGYEYDPAYQYDSGYTLDQQPYSPAGAPPEPAYQAPAYTAPDYSAPTPDYAYEAQQPSLDPGYTLDQGYRPPAQPSPDYVTMPGETSPYNPATGDYYQAPDTAWLAPTVDPSRNPVMPAPQPVSGAPAMPRFRYSPADNFDATGLYGGGYATPDLTEHAWSRGTSQAFTAESPADATLADFFAATEQGPQIVADAQTWEDTRAQLQEDQALRQAGARHGGADPYSYDATGNYGGYDPAPPQPSWIGDRFSNLGSWADENRQDAAPVTDAIGAGLGTTWDRFTDPYRRTFPQVATDINAEVDLPPGPNIDLSQVDPLAGVSRPLYNAATMAPWEQVDPNTPVLGGLGQSLESFQTNYDAATSIPDRLGAIGTGISDLYGKPLDWSQERQGDLAGRIATGELDAGPYQQITKFLPTEQIPVIGQAFESPTEWVAQGSPELRAEVARVYTEAEATQPGSGGRAVWEYYQDPAFRNAAQRLTADTASDPLVAVTGLRPAGGAMSAYGRLLQSSARPGVRVVGTGIRGTGAVVQAAGGAADELADMGLTSSLGWAGSRLRGSRLGQWAGTPFALTPEAQAEREVSTHLDAVGGLQRTVRESGLPPDPGAELVPPGSNPNIPPGAFTINNTSRQRRGKYTQVTNDQDQIIITRRENSEVVTPHPLNQEQADAFFDNLGGGEAEAVAVAERMRVGWNDEPLASAPVPSPPTHLAQEAPAGRTAEDHLGTFGTHDLYASPDGDMITAETSAGLTRAAAIQEGGKWSLYDERGDPIGGFSGPTEAMEGMRQYLATAYPTNRIAPDVAQAPMPAMPTGSAFVNDTPPTPLREDAQEIARLRRAAETGQPVDLPPGPPSQSVPPPPTHLMSDPGFSITRRGNRQRLTRDAGDGTTRPPNEAELEAVYQELHDLPEDQFLTYEGAIWRGEMYNQGFLRKSPAPRVRPEVRQRADNEFVIVDARTNLPLDPRAHKVDRDYRTAHHAQTRVDGMNEQASSQQLAYERFVDLQAHRMKNSGDPLRFEQELRNPAGGSTPVKDDVIADIKAKANIANPTQPPAPNGHAVTREGQRVIDPAIDTTGAPSIYVADTDAEQVRWVGPAPEFRGRDTTTIANRFAVVEQPPRRGDRYQTTSDWNVYRRQPDGAWSKRPIATTFSQQEGIAYAQDAIRRESGPNANPANRLGITPPTAAETAHTGFTDGQSLRDKMARPDNVRRTLGQAETDVPTQARFEQMPLATEERVALRRPMPKTHGKDVTLGDAVLKVTDDVFEAAELAKPSTILDARGQKRLNDLSTNYNTTPERLAEIGGDLDALDRMVFERIANDLRTELVPVGGESNVLVQALDNYLRYRRSIALYNKLRVPGYILANVVGNGITTGLFRPSALFGRGMLWDPANVLRVRDNIKGTDRFGKTFPDRSVYGNVAKSLGYSPRASVVGVTRRDQLDQLWGFSDKSSGFSKALGPKLLSEEGWFGAQAIDQSMREAIGADVLRQHLPRMIREIRVHAKDSARRMGVLLGDEQIDIAIDALVEAARRNKANGGIPAFSQTSLREALRILPTMGGETTTGWAERVSRDWREATGKLMADADAEVNRLAFTFRQTNIDKAVSKFILFHYWASRASMRYVTEGMKNPWMIAAYFRATEGLNKMAEENNFADSVKGALKIFDSIGGYAGFFRPELILPHFLMTSETVFREEGEYGLTQLGQGLQWLGDHGIGIVPLWRLFTYYSGAEGGSYAPPDISGAGGPMDTLGAVANILNASGILGQIGLEYGDNGPEQLPAPAAELHNRVAHWISGLFANEMDLPGVKQVPLELEGYFRGERELGMIVADIVARDHREQSPAEQAETIKEIMAASDGPIYDEAYDMWSLREGTIGAQRTVAPGGAGQVALRNVGNDQRRIDKQTGTADEQQAAYDIDAAVNSADPADAAYETNLTEYDALRDHLGHDLAETYNRIGNNQVRGPFKINGQEYTRWHLAAMSEGERWDLANEWLAAMGEFTGVDARARMETRFDAQNAYLAEHADIAAMVEFRERANEYGPGIDQFILDTAAINAPYRQYVNGIPEPVGSEEWRDKATNRYSASQAVQGQATDIFSAIQDMEGAGRVAGLPEETTLANAQSIRQQEREAEQEAQQAEYEESQAGWREYNEDVSTSLMYFNDDLTEHIQVLRDAGVGDADIELYLSRVGFETEGKLPSHIYGPLRDAFGTDRIYPAPRNADGSRNGAALDYWVARRHDPALVLEDFLSTRSRENREEREAFSPETQLAGTPAFTGELPEADQPPPPNNGLQTWGEMSGQSGVDAGGGELPLGGAWAPATRAPAPDLIFSVLGGADTNTDYGFRAPTDLPFYGYFEGHGGTPREHTGIDATGVEGQPLFTPMGGTVTCAGTGNGGGSWGTGCAEFGDDYGRAGRVEIMLDDGSSLILGHAAEAYVWPGQRVEPGDLVAAMGLGNGEAHVHVERRVWDNAAGTYIIVDPEGNPVASYAP